MTGEELKTKLKKTGKSQSEIAQMLGMPNQQALYQALKADDVKSGLIEDCCKKLGLSIVEIYEGSDCVIAKGNSTAFKGNGNTVGADLGKSLEEIAAQRRLTEEVVAQNGRLLSIIEKMKI